MADETKTKNIFATILTIIAVIFAVTLISKLLKDWKRTSNEDIISKEGKDILNDSAKTTILRDAITQYHNEGTWIGLEELNHQSDLKTEPS